MRLQFKFGLKSLLRSPFRLIVCFLLITLSLAAAGMRVFSKSFSVFEWEKSSYFSLPVKYTPITTSVSVGGLAEMTRPGGRTQDSLLTIQDGLTKIGVDKYAVTLDKSLALSYGESLLEVPGQFSLFRPWYFLGDTENLTDTYTVLGDETYLAPNISVNWITSYERSPSVTTEMNALINNYFNRITCYSDGAPEEFGYQVYGRLPQGLNEIAIPQWLYNSFLCYGYRNPDTGEVFPVQSEADLMEKKMWLGTNNGAIISVNIVGVIHTDLSEEEKNCSPEYYFASYLTAISPCYGVAVSEECYSTFQKVKADDYFSWVYVLRAGQHEDEIYDFVAGFKKGKSLFDLYERSGEFARPIAPTQAVVTYRTDMRTQQLFINGFLLKAYNEYMLYFEIAPYLTLFAAVLILYFSASTIYGKHKSIRLLRQLGSGTGKIFLCFVLWLTILLLVCGFLAIGLQEIIISAMNAGLYKISLADPFLSSIPFTAVFSLTKQTILFDLGLPVLIAMLPALFLLKRGKRI